MTDQEQKSYRQQLRRIVHSLINFRTYLHYPYSNIREIKPRFLEPYIAIKYETVKLDSHYFAQPKDLCDYKKEYRHHYLF